jgi:hypothetical protein
MGVEDVSPALQAQLGPDATIGLLALFDTARQEWKTDVIAAAIERFERRLTEDVSGLRGEMREMQIGLRGEMHAVEARLRGEMREGEVRLREEMRDLAAELREEGRVNTAALREEMRSGVSNLRVELKDEMSKVRVDVAGALAKARVDMMRWSFSLWVGQVVATAAIVAIVAGMFRVFAQ